MYVCTCTHTEVYHTYHSLYKPLYAQGSTIPINNARPNSNLCFTRKEPLGYATISFLPSLTSFSLFIIETSPTHAMCSFVHLCRVMMTPCFFPFPPPPRSVCGIVVPWNYPLMMVAWKVGACLAAGNAQYKHSHCTFSGHTSNFSTTQLPTITAVYYIHYTKVSMFRICKIAACICILQLKYYV